MACWPFSHSPDSPRNGLRDESIALCITGRWLAPSAGSAARIDSDLF